MSDKVELRNAGETEGNLVILKSEVEKWLWSKEKINDPKYEVELKKLQELFEKNKKDIKFITQSELRELTGAINDTAPNGKAEELEGVFSVDKQTGELKFEKNTAENALKEPEKEGKESDTKPAEAIKQLIQVNPNTPLPPEIQQNIAELGNKEKPFWYNIVEKLSKIPFLGSFFASFLWLKEWESIASIDTTMSMISGMLTKIIGSETLATKLSEWTIEEKQSLIWAIKSQPELLRWPNIDPKKLQIYLTHILQQDPITGWDIYGFLTGQITSYPASEVNLSGYAGNIDEVDFLAENAGGFAAPIEEMTDEQRLQEAQKIDNMADEDKKDTERERIFTQEKEKIISIYTNLDKKKEELNTQKAALELKSPKPEDQIRIFDGKIKILEKKKEQIQIIIESIFITYDNAGTLTPDAWEIKVNTTTQWMVTGSLKISHIMEETQTAVDQYEKSQQEALDEVHTIFDTLRKHQDGHMNISTSAWKKVNLSLLKSVEEIIKKYESKDGVKNSNDYKELQEMAKYEKEKTNIVRDMVKKKNQLGSKKIEFTNIIKDGDESGGGWAEIDPGDNGIELDVSGPDIFWYNDVTFLSASDVEKIDTYPDLPKYEGNVQSKMEHIRRVLQANADTIRDASNSDMFNI
jgi:hypothetical protein